MRTKNRIVMLTLALALLLGLTACAAGPEMPMEATVDGYTVVLGETTMQDLIDLGYEVYYNGRQDAARDGDKYIAFHYSLSKGAGSQFWVSVYVPWSGNTNISAEQNASATEGIVYSITLRDTATEDITATYNGIDIKDMKFADAESWGAKEEEGSYKATWELTAAKGFLTFKESLDYEKDGELGELRLSLSKGAFEKMQK